MRDVQRAIGRARRRLLVQAWVSAMGTLLLVALGVVLVMLLMDRLIAVQVPWPAYAVVGGLALLAAPVIAFVQRPDDEATAALLDHRLKLKDRFGTSLYISQRGDSDPFAKQVLDDAAKAATGLRVAEATPIGFTRTWAWAPVLAIVAAGIFFLPPQDLLGLQEQQAQARADQEQADRIEEQILQARSMMQSVETSESPLDEADPTALENRLASLTRKDLSSPERRREAAAELTAIQDKLRQAQEIKEQEFRSLQNQMSRLETGIAGPADKFADALRRGDFEAAQQELEALAAKFEQMSEQERQQTAEQLQNLASQLQNMSQQQAMNQQQAQQAAQQAQQQSMQQQLQQQGLSQQQIQQLQQQGFNQQAVQQALQQQGMTQQQAQQAAQQMQQQAQQSGQQAQQQAQQQQQQQQGGQQQQSGGMSQQQQAMGQSLQQMAQGMQNGNGNQVQQGQWSSQQSMQQMQQMQQQLQQMQQTQQSLQQAMNGMGQQGQQGQQPGQGQQQGQGQGQGQSQGQGQGQQQANQSGGQGGQQWGTGSGGNPLGAERQASSVGAYSSEDFQEKQGRIIASWQEKGQNAAGDPTVDFNTQITEARDQAERAVTDDRVPRRYHESIRQYFQQLPDAANETRSAPRAPR